MKFVCGDDPKHATMFACPHINAEADATAQDAYRYVMKSGTDMQKARVAFYASEADDASNGTTRWYYYLGLIIGMQQGMEDE